MQVSGIHPDLDGVPVPGVIPAGPDDDVARRVVGQVTVDVRVAAQVLDQRDLDRQLAVADRQIDVMQDAGVPLAGHDVAKGE